MHPPFLTPDQHEEFSRLGLENAARPAALLAAATICGPGAKPSEVITMAVQFVPWLMECGERQHALMLSAAPQAPVFTLRSVDNSQLPERPGP